MIARVKSLTFLFFWRNIFEIFLKNFKKTVDNIRTLVYNIIKQKEK